MTRFCGLMKKRVTVLTDFWKDGYYFFEDVRDYEPKMIKKRWKPERQDKFDDLITTLENTSPFDAVTIETQVKTFVANSGLKFGMLYLMHEF